jgi:hypothetical protein
MFTVTMGASLPSKLDPASRMKHVCSCGATFAWRGPLVAHIMGNDASHRINTHVNRSVLETLYGKRWNWSK